MLSSSFQFVRRLTGYPWYEVAAELVILTLAIYLVLRFLRTTRGSGAFRGFLILIVVVTLLIRVVGEVTGAFTRLTFIYDRFLGLVAILLIVVFQPELRRAMMRLGSTRFFRPTGREVRPVVEAACKAAELLSKSNFGALIAIERQEDLSALAQTGTVLDARVSARLVQSIFWPNSPLHDLGVVIQGDRVTAAGVQFPLIEEGAIDAELGSRHRAGLGLSAETDAIVVIVSEETGAISLADGGRFERQLSVDQLRSRLIERLRAPLRESQDDADEPPDDSRPAESSAERKQDSPARREPVEASST